MWGAGGGLVDKLQLNEPVFCLTLNTKRKQLICGMHASINVYNLDEEKESGHYINPIVRYVAKEHTDIVPCVACCESRVYSAGYDQQLIIYESVYNGTLRPLFINSMAHDAGITCLNVIKDYESQIWVVTGSFDKTVRIWSSDGKLVHRLEGFTSSITGLCYVPRCRTMWVTAGTTDAILFDPKSGDNVSNFVGTFQSHKPFKHPLLLLRFFLESNQVVGTTSRRQLMVWKYNPSGCISSLKCQAGMDSITYTKKMPILYFSGDNDGTITKFEQMQSSYFMYSKELMPLSETLKTKKKRRRDKEKEDLKREILEEEATVQLVAQQSQLMVPKSQYSHNAPLILKPPKRHRSELSILRTVFVEELDLLIAACENGHIYVWGFDDDAVKALKRMEPKKLTSRRISKHYKILLSSSSDLLSQSFIQNDESVTNRVAGFICKHIFSEHQATVTSLAVIGREDGQNGTYLVSGGWDRRLCIWDLEEGVLLDVFHNKSTQNIEAVELACDGVIFDIAFCPGRNEIAYATSDHVVYLRQFSTNGSQMVLLNTLQGHYGDVTCVKWNPVKSVWVTGSEDATIRVWSCEGLNDCIQVLSVQAAVNSMCIDLYNGAIVAGIQQFIRVYDPDLFRLVQTNVGHTDTVRCIIHVPERSQYVSTSWDKTMRMWNAWRPPLKKKHAHESSHTTLTASSPRNVTTKVAHRP
jgi:WD40 repeat protein